MKIFLYNLPNYQTGGVEAIYQLCDAINSQSGEAYIYHKHYTDNNPGSSLDLVPDRYKKYNLKFSNVIEDKKENILILAETFTNDIYKYLNIQKAIWWLSVDNNKKEFNQFNDTSILHLYQSYYALNFLMENKVSKYLPMFDYIDIDIQQSNTKKDIVCYNPLKGMDTTSRIISQCPNVNFQPLSNMSKQDINRTLRESKIYIDFGHHPGKDRIPREAALNDCLILVGMRGSAKFFNDMPISLDYKLKQIDNNIETYIISLFKTYSVCIEDFSLYKKNILKEKEEFFNQAKIFI